MYDKLTRFGRTDVQDECRCGLNKMIAEKSMKYILDNMPLFEKAYILNYDDRNELNSKNKIK